MDDNGINNIRLWKWQRGRQEHCVYYKFPLWRIKIGRFGSDGYILKYLPNTSLPLHTDPSDGKHYRMNISLSGSSDFICEKCILKSKIINVFRPDLYLHKLNIKTKTFKLSIGLLIK